MKKIVFLAVALALISCGGVSRIFDSGTVSTSNYYQLLPFNYENNFALINVVIQGDSYTFLVDTGAPTCISTEIYEKLNIKPAKIINISDANGQTDNHPLILVPEIKIGELIYNNIGAVVADLRDVFEFDCMKIDGIIGANQMSKSFWKFDYENKNITITDQVSKLELQSYPDSLKFFNYAQKTPFIVGKVNGKVATFTYDTGFRGNIDVKRNLEDFENLEGFTKYGSPSIGLYGAQDSVATRTVKLDSLKLGKIFVGVQTVDLAYGSLIGNEFMNKHEMVIDWKNNYIYLKKIQNYKSTEKSSLGFNARFIKNKLNVVALVKEIPTDLKIGDQILSINDHDLSNLDNVSACDTYSNFKLNEIETAAIKYMRDGKVFTTRLSKTMLIK